LQSVNNDSQLNQIDEIVSRMTDNMAQSCTAAELAKELDMTESAFSRFFRRATGNTYTDFVNQVRVNRACQMLMESDRLITDICYEVGFNNVANFNRRFLGLKGMTPSEFRRQVDTRFGPRAPVRRAAQAIHGRDAPLGMTAMAETIASAARMPSTPADRMPPA